MAIDWTTKDGRAAEYFGCGLSRIYPDTFFVLEEDENGDLRIRKPDEFEQYLHEGEEDEEDAK